jgi:predicted anti-sigma-YlaC factor YlaD
MSVKREVILDLLPVYLAGEASPATRALVEEFLAQDPEFAQSVRSQQEDTSLRTLLPELPPELELKSLRRTRYLLGWQRWLFGLGIGFSVVALTSEFSFKEGHLREFHFLIRDYPSAFGTCVVIGLACWIAYFCIRHRLRTTSL